MYLMGKEGKCSSGRHVQTYNYSFFLKAIIFFFKPCEYYTKYTPLRPAVKIFLLITAPYFSLRSIVNLGTGRNHTRTW